MTSPFARAPSPFAHAPSPFATQKASTSLPSVAEFMHGLQVSPLDRGYNEKHTVSVPNTNVGRSAGIIISKRPTPLASQRSFEYKPGYLVSQTSAPIPKKKRVSWKMCGDNIHTQVYPVSDNKLIRKSVPKKHSWQVHCEKELDEAVYGFIQQLFANVLRAHADA